MICKEEESTLNKIASGIMLILFLLGSLSLAFNIHTVKAEPGTIYIRADGSIDPPTANITTSDYVTYTFTDNNYDSIVVQRSNITIDGNGYFLQGTGSSGSTGVEISGVNNVTIENMNIGNFSSGILLHFSNYSNINCNYITANNRGIYLAFSFNNTISENIFVNDGLDVYVSYGNVVVDNLVNGKPMVYLEDVSDVVVGDAGQVILVNCNRMQVEDLDLSNTSTGIQLWQTQNTKISGNNIRNNNGYGIYLYYSSNNTVCANNITNNGFGVKFEFSSNNTVLVNNITNNDVGVYFIPYSFNNSVSENNIRNNNWGVYLDSSSDNKILHNNFLDNNIQAYSSTSGYANVWDAGYPSGGNYWSNYTGVDTKNGLYQNQTGSDGIGDTPYVIDANNTDHYPLMGTFNSYPVRVLVRVPQFNVTVISNSTITGFITPLSLETLEVTIWFSVIGKQGSTGFCRVSIPTAMMNGTYQVFVNGTEIPYTLLPCSNANVSYLYFTYTQSTKCYITILPEFPFFLILPLFMIITLLGAIILKRKRNVKE
jgi:parallel beta-helix repeat protein